MGLSLVEPRILLLLVGVAVMLVILAIVRIRAGALLKRFADPNLLPLISAAPPRWATLGAPLLTLGAMGLVIIALARPQTGATTITVRGRNMDILVAIDLSTSMLAPDTPPYRLEAAKRASLALLEMLSGERIGIMGFAGDAFLACPLTTDYSSARMFLEALDPSFLSQPGTSLARAVEVAASSFPAEGEATRVLLVMSDGEDHVGGVDEAAREAAKHGIQVFSLGVGTPQGELIPLDAAGADYKRDPEGHPVMTKLNEESLLKISLRSGGKYYRLRKGLPEIAALYADLRQIPSSATKREQKVEGLERYQYPLGLAIASVLAGLALRGVSARRPARRKRWQ